MSVAVTHTQSRQKMLWICAHFVDIFDGRVIHTAL